MSAAWKKICDRFERFSTRERIIIMLALLAIIYVAADTAFLSPLAVRRARSAEEAAQNRVQIARFGQQLAALAQQNAVDLDRPNRERAATLSARVALLEQTIRDQSSRLVEPQRMAQVLRQVLAERPRVQLAELKTLPRVTVNLASGATPDPAASKTDTSKTDASAAQAVLYRHGLQLSVRGNYLDLLAYLRDIEALPVRFYWEKLDLNVLEYPDSQLTVMVNTVGIDKAWMKL